MIYSFYYQVWIIDTKSILTNIGPCILFIPFLLLKFSRAQTDLHLLNSSVPSLCSTHSRLPVSLVTDSRHALELLERIQEKLHNGDDPSHEADLATLIYMLDSPLFSQLLNLQDAIEQLKQVRENVWRDSLPSQYGFFNQGEAGL